MQTFLLFVSYLLYYLLYDCLPLIMCRIVDVLKGCISQNIPFIQLFRDNAARDISCTPYH